MFSLATHSTDPRNDRWLGPTGSSSLDEFLCQALVLAVLLSADWIGTLPCPELAGLESKFLLLTLRLLTTYYLPPLCVNYGGPRMPVSTIGTGREQEHGRLFLLLSLLASRMFRAGARGFRNRGT